MRASLCVLLLSSCLLSTGCDAPPAPKGRALNLRHETSFVVFPADCNANQPMLFGGKVLAEMDRCAGVTTRRLLYASEVKDAVLRRTATP